MAEDHQTWLDERRLIEAAPIRDQRTMVDVHDSEGIHRTIADIEEAWRQWTDREGLAIRRRRGDWSTDLRTSRKTVIAYVSGAKWIADCPSCNGGIACWHENPRGCCLDCGTIYQVDHPSDRDRQRAEELLGEREEAQRHWHRHHGETLEDLARENEQLSQAKILQGAVSLGTLQEILGDKAIDKLAKAGVL